MIKTLRDTVRWYWNWAHPLEILMFFGILGALLAFAVIALIATV